MRTRPFRRAAALALAGSLAVSAIASADTVQADGDLLAAGTQGSVDVGIVAPGAEVQVEVGFVLVCGNLQHADAGQTVVLTFAGGVQPDDGEIVSGTDGAVGPVPVDWTTDGEGCPFPAPRLEGTTAGSATLRAPTTPGPHEFVLEWTRSLTPDGSADASALTGMTVLTVHLDVVPGGGGTDTTAPTLVGLPADIHVTTSDPAGAVVTYTPPTATDDTDPAPAVACAPASGTRFPVGVTGVVCTATDAAGNSDQASFDVTVSHVPAPPVSATWGEPVGVDGGSIVANRGRTIPVKVRLAGPSGEVTTGQAALLVSPCGSTGGQGIVVPLAVTGGKWQALLTTATLSGDCHVVTVTHDGVASGSFQLELRGAEAARAASRGR